MIRKTIVNLTRCLALLLPAICWFGADAGMGGGGWLAMVFIGLALTYSIAETEAVTHGWLYCILVAGEGLAISFLSAKGCYGSLYTHFALCVAFVQIVMLALRMSKGTQRKEWPNDLPEMQ